ncbi:MAG: hypothetical protein Q7J84_13860 [Sulfuricaulis sp.]|nr:hypothetical protein [Sulfuricaulis sp.]
MPIGDFRIHYDGQMKARNVIPRDAAMTKLVAERVNDPFDLIRDLIEDGNNWLALDEFDFPERYRKTHSHLAVRWVPTFSNDQYDIFIKRLPTGSACRDEVLATGQSEALDATSKPPNGYQAIVPVYVGESIENPKGIIPSLIWLPSMNDLLMGSRELLYFSLRSWKHEIRLISGKWEIGSLGVLSPVCGGQTAGENIERGPELIDGFSDNKRNFIGDGLLKAEFDRIARSMRITLCKNSVWLTVVEGGALPFDIRDVAFCANDF